MKRIKQTETSQKLASANQKPAGKHQKGYSIIDEETAKWLKEYYGLIDEFPFEQLITQSKKERFQQPTRKNILIR